MTWQRSFQRHFNVEYTWCVGRVGKEIKPNTDHRKISFAKKEKLKERKKIKEERKKKERTVKVVC